MKYILLIYQNPEAMQSLPDDERQALMNEAGTIMEELEASGEWVGGEALADPSTAKVVKVREGVPAVTDGPFIEAKEHLIGYCLFEVENQERALEIAARWPDARTTGVELRPLMDTGGTEM